MHRVIDVTDDGYVMRGDNCYYDENVQEEDVLGVLIGYYNKNKYVQCTDKSYLRYAKNRVKRYPIRHFFIRVWCKIKNMFGKLVHANKSKETTNNLES